MIINIFCDASIDTNKKIACGGCYIVMQDNEIHPIGYKMYIQHNATNNSAEILAIWTGIAEAIRIRQSYPNAIFRLFSDSKISLYGLRDWIKNWIKNSQVRGTDILINSSGQEVANQQYFIDIFNVIVETGLHIEFYHQRGHVGESGGVNLERARTQFIKANKVSPENLGLGIEFISLCNHYIDSATRTAMRKYIDFGVVIDNTQIQPIDPMHHYIRSNMLPQYIRNINKTSVISRHDFKGGYNQ